MEDNEFSYWHVEFQVTWYIQVGCAEHSLAEKSGLKGYVSQVSWVSASRDNRFSSIIIIFCFLCSDLPLYDQEFQSPVPALSPRISKSSHEMHTSVQEFHPSLFSRIRISHHPCLTYVWLRLEFMTHRLEKLITLKARTSHQSHSGFDEI